MRRGSCPALVLLSTLLPHWAIAFLGVLAMFTMIATMIRLIALLALALAFTSTAEALNNLSRTPPMGWMSWQAFRCETDCVEFPDDCISEKLYRDQASCQWRRELSYAWRRELSLLASCRACRARRACHARRS